MNLHRAAIPQRLMRTTVVVQHHCLTNRSTSIRLAQKPTSKAIFTLENTIQTLGLAVLIAMIYFGLADAKSAAFEFFNISCTAILDLHS